jgi:hypothetical protein
MALTGPGFFNLNQARQLQGADARAAFLETQTAQDALEIGRTLELPEASLASLERFGQLMGRAPLFAPRPAAHRDGTRPAMLGFTLRLRELMREPEAESAQHALQRVVARHRGTLQALGPRERAEWGLIVRLARREVDAPIALEAGLEATLSHLASARTRRASAPQSNPDSLTVLQAERRRLLLNLLEQPEFDAVYRYTRDHAVNEPLRRSFGLANVPPHVLAEPRPRLAPEANAGGRAPYTPIADLSTGAFVDALDRGLASLQAIQGRDHQTLLRATLFRRPWVEAMAESGEFLDHGYVSTSRYPDKLEGFFRNAWSTRYPDEVPVLMVFETERAVDVSCLSRFANESEHLIPRGQGFRAEYLGRRRELFPEVQVPDADDWAIFVMTDDGAPPSPSARRSIEAPARRPGPTP